MKKNAIVLGGTLDHIKLILYLKELDYQVYLIDYLENPPAAIFADFHIQKSTLDKDGVLAFSKEINASLVIATSIDQALDTMVYVAHKLGLPSHLNPEQIMTVTNKSYMKDFFKKNSIPSAKFEIYESESAALNDLPNLKLPLVVKPVDANSSKGVRKINSYFETDPIRKAFSISRSKKIVVEEFKNGKELSVDAIVVNGDVQIAMVTQNIKTIEKSPFTITASFYDKDFEKEMIPKVLTFANKIVNSLKINGLLLLQFIYENENIDLIEFSSRIGGGSKHCFIKAITNFDIMRFFLDSILLKDIRGVDLSKRNYNYSLIQYFYCDQGVISNFVGFEEFKTKEIIKEYYFYKSVGSEIKSAESSTDRAAGVLIVGQSKEEVLEKLHQVSSGIKVEGSDGKNILKPITTNWL